jgi:hypothetical protein
MWVLEMGQKAFCRPMYIKHEIAADTEYYLYPTTFALRLVSRFLVSKEFGNDSSYTFLHILSQQKDGYNINKWK